MNWELVAKVRDWVLIPFLIPLAILGIISEWIDEAAQYQRFKRQFPEFYAKEAKK